MRLYPAEFKAVGKAEREGWLSLGGVQAEDLFIHFSYLGGRHLFDSDVSAKAGGNTFTSGNITEADRAPSSGNVVGEQVRVQEVAVALSEEILEGFSGWEEPSIGVV